MEVWASHAGKLQARIWFEEEHYRLLELSAEGNLEFTGRSDGPFEIWTWRHYENPPSLSVETADEHFVDGLNSRMRRLWDRKQGDQDKPKEAVTPLPTSSEAR